MYIIFLLYLSAGPWPLQKLTWILIIGKGGTYDDRAFNYGNNFSSIHPLFAVRISYPTKTVYGNWLLLWRWAVFSFKETTEIHRGYDAILFSSNRTCVGSFASSHDNISVRGNMIRVFAVIYYFLCVLLVVHFSLFDCMIYNYCVPY